MSRRVAFTVDGRSVETPAGTTLAAALWNAGVIRFRSSVRGEPRAPVCGMGICFECRVTLDGVPGVRACTVLCEDGMRVELP